MFNGKYKKLFLPFTIFIAVILRIINLNQSLWLDEAAQAIESQRAISVLWQLDVDFHPPLFHYLLHFWQYLGTSEWLMRLLPVSFGVATVYAVYLLGKKLLDEKLALIFSLFMATAPYHVYYSQELRNYSLITLLAVLSYYFLLERKWGLYTLSLVLALYSNYFAVFLILAQGIYVVISRHSGKGKARIQNQDDKWLKKYLICASIALASFSPWFYQLKFQLERGATLTEALPMWRDLSAILPLWEAIPQTFIKFALGRITFDDKNFYSLLTMVIFVFYLGIGSIGAIRKSQAFKFFAIFLAVPFFTALLFSTFLPINGPWRLLLILPAFYGLLSLGVNAIPKYINLVALTIILGINLGGLLIYYTNPRFQRENWRGAVAFVKQNTTNSSVTLFEFPGPFAPYLWYNKGDRNAYGAFEGLSGEYNKVDTRLSKVTVNKKTVFLFQYLQELTDREKLVEQWLTDQGYYQTGITNFEGVGFLYEYERP